MNSPYANSKPTKEELANMKALSDSGLSASSIATRMGKSHVTVMKYLRTQEYWMEPEIQELIDRIKKRELSELHGIGGKARAILNNYLDECLDGTTKVNPISVTAILDRTFTQRSLLEGRPTEIQGVHNMVSYIQGEIVELKKKREEILKRLEASTVEADAEEVE